MFVDGSFQDTDGFTGAGMVLRYKEGRMIFVASRYLFYSVDAYNKKIVAMEGVVLAL